MITKFKNKNDKIKYLEKQLKRYKRFSFIDSLTGLYNRRKLEKDIDKFLARGKRYKDHYYVIMIDIDKFKQINDVKGHKAGDKVLKKVAQILRDNLRKGENCYRLSGDEFIIIIRDYPIFLTKRIYKILKKHKIEISKGFYPLTKNILEKVDKKMYEDKRKHKQRS